MHLYITAFIGIFIFSIRVCTRINVLKNTVEMVYERDQKIFAKIRIFCFWTFEITTLLGEEKRLIVTTQNKKKEKRE